MDDQGLVDRTLAGDDAAFELLVRRHADRLWRLVRPIVGDDHTAEEVVQDAFLRAYRGLGSYRGDASVGTWLSSICYRTAIDEVRRRQLDVVPIDRARSAESRDGTRDHELRLLLGEAITELPDDERDAFHLVHVMGHSSSEAAEIVGVPASTLRSRIGRARERLALALTDVVTADGEV